MAEILVRAHNSWMESVPREEKDRWTAAMWAKYNRRRRKGSPVVVKPDGCRWGKNEGPPRYIIVKLPGVKVEDAREYAEKTYYPPIEKNLSEVKLLRKYEFDLTTIDDTLADVSNNNGIITTTKANFESLLTDKSLEL